MQDRFMKLAVPDMISNSYFPAEAAVELGFFKAEGLDVELELIFPVDKCYAALRDGAVDFVGGSAHSALAAFPRFQGAKLICAQAQGMYWFLIMHADLGAKRGDVAAVKGKRIGAAPWVDMGLRELLVEAGIDLQRDGVTIAPVPGAVGAGVNFGLTAAKALEDRKIDGFWANGMGAEVALRRGVGTMVLDIRRGGRGGARCGEDASSIEGGCDAGRKSRRQTVPAVGSRIDYRPDPPRFALLRRDAIAGFCRRHERVCPQAKHSRQRSRLRECR